MLIYNYNPCLLFANILLFSKKTKLLEIKQIFIEKKVIIMAQNNFNQLSQYGYPQDGNLYIKKEKYISEENLSEEMQKIVGNAPEEYDTLEEIAGAIESSGIDTSAITAELENKADKSELAEYAKTEDLENYATKDELEDYATKDDVNDVKTSVETMLEGAPDAFDTLKEIVDELNKKENATEVVEALATKADKTEIPDVSEFITMNDVEGLGYITEEAADEKYQPKGEYLTEHQSLEDYALKTDIPNVSGLATEEFVTEGFQPKGEYLTEHQSLEGLMTEEAADEKYQPKGEYLTEHQSLEEYATKADLDDYVKTEDLPAEQDLSAYALKTDLDNYQPVGNYLTEHQSLEGLMTEEAADEKYQPKGEYLTEHQSLADYALKTDIPNVSDFITSEFAAQTYQPIGNYLTEHQSLEDYALRSELPNLNNYYDKDSANGIFVAKSAFEDAIVTKADKTSLAEVVLDLSRRLNKLEATNTYFMENNTDKAEDIINMSSEDAADADITVSSDDAIAALATPKTFKSINVVGGELGDDTVITLSATDDVNVNGLTVGGDKGEGNGKINYATNVINIDSLDINPGCTVYNVFEGSQDGNPEHCIDKFTAKNITVNDTDLQHNVFNIYQLNDNAEIEISDSYFNLDVANSNVLRLSNITNASNVTVTFNNVDLTYENKGYTNDDTKWAGLVIYQAYGSDVAFTGDTSKTQTWTFNFINCRYNGRKITENNVGTIEQLIYQYKVGGNGNEAPTAFGTINVE